MPVACGGNCDKIEHIMKLDTTYLALLWEEIAAPLDAGQYSIMAEICNRSWAIEKKSGVSLTPESDAIRFAKIWAVTHPKPTN